MNYVKTPRIKTKTVQSGDIHEQTCAALAAYFEGLARTHYGCYVTSDQPISIVIPAHETAEEMATRHADEEAAHYAALLSKAVAAERERLLVIVAEQEVLARRAYQENGRINSNDYAHLVTISGLRAELAKPA